MKYLITVGVLLGLVALTCSSPTEPEGPGPYLFVYGKVRCDEPIPVEEVVIGWGSWNGQRVGPEVHPDKEGIYKFYAFPNSLLYWEGKLVGGFAYENSSHSGMREYTDWFYYPGSAIRVDFYLRPS